MIDIKPIQDEKLQPCPFCGSEYVYTRSTDYDEFRVSCNKCEAEGPIALTPSDAEFAWNKTRYRGK